jgi:5-methylcytosine-specific restriction protein A
MTVKRTTSNGNDVRKKIRDRQYNKQRYSDDNALFTEFYKSTAWKKTRGYVVARANGLCESCLKYGRIRQGKIVDHIKPLKQNWDSRLDVTNLQYLCPTCHNRKTKAEKWKAIQAKKKAKSVE